GASTALAAMCCSGMAPSAFIPPLWTATSGSPCARATGRMWPMVSDVDSRRKLAVRAGGILALIGIAWIFWPRLPPPQLIADEQVFNTVDALFTAVTSRDRTRLEDCERRLQEYHEDGKLSDAAARALDAIINQARDGKWEPAAKALYSFMLGQRG